MPDERIVVLPQELLVIGAAVKTGMVEALRKTLLVLLLLKN
ncbi:hypothetical protein [Desulfosporosinus sp. BG]|nr:hypothetical protein [Desulfosporosinus sp. BG]ODA39236.1 hypothetical protein DSBG_3982 [Desulfosporosinus sp. BG]